MTRLRVALLQCDHVDAALRPIAGDYDAMFATLLAEAVPDLDLEAVDVVGGAPVPAPGEHDALIVSGSRHSVTDGLPWIEHLEEGVRGAIGDGIPVVGICFGHQLIATALGGTVERAAVGWGAGVHHAEVVEPRDWMQPARSSFRLLVSHRDQVTTSPPGATVVATSEHAPVAAFEVGSALGFQGHPEFVPAYADALLDRRAELMGAAVVTRARETLTTPTDHAAVATWIGRFVASRRGARHPAPDRSSVE